MGLDIQLLSRWFNKGYSSREMATFLLLSEVLHPETKSRFELTAEEISIQWERLHEEVCKIIYQK